MNTLIIVLLGLLAVTSAKISVTITDPKNSIDSQYIIVFADGVSKAERDDHMAAIMDSFVNDEFDNTILGRFEIGDFNGFSAKLSTKMLTIERNSAQISYIEQDAKVFMSQDCTIQTGATWGIDRIAEIELNLDGYYNYSSTGQGVDAYIVDTGIYLTNRDFGGRAIWGANFADSTNTDCNGHGTHVAGTVGGTVYGVAKDVNLIAVKVLDCSGSGSNAGVINGINWVVTSQKSRKNPSVANMSLGGSYSAAVNSAVKSATTAGISFAVAAGNENDDACNGSPSSEKSAITVGATGTDFVGRSQVDNRAYFSNYGSCVSIFAPGLEITSAWIGSVSAINTISGTSMASPHVAGIVAVYLQQNPEASASAVKSWLVNGGTEEIISLDCAGAGNQNDCNESPNIMAYSPC